MVLGNIRSFLSIHLYIWSRTARNYSRYFYSSIFFQPSKQASRADWKKKHVFFLHYDLFLTPFLLRIPYTLCCIFFALGDLAKWNIWRITLFCFFFLFLSRLLSNHSWGSCSEVPLGGWWASQSGACNKGEHLLIPSIAQLSSSICQLLPPRRTAKEINAFLEAEAHRGIYELRGSQSTLKQVKHVSQRVAQSQCRAVI